MDDEDVENVNLGTKAAINTYALAWFSNGVAVSSEPVLTGYRLVLAYHLIQASTTAILPSLDDQAQRVDGVRQVLLQWKQAKKGRKSNTIPEVLYYASFYPNHELRPQIASVASELGINLYQGEIEIHQEGEVDEPRNYKSRRERSRYEGNEGFESDNGEDDDVKFKKVETEEFKVKKLSTLDDEPVENFSGVPIDENEIIPKNFRDGLKTPDEHAFEGIWVSRCISCKHSRLLTRFVCQHEGRLEHCEYSNSAIHTRN